MTENIFKEPTGKANLLRFKLLKIANSLSPGNHIWKENGVAVSGNRWEYAEYLVGLDTADKPIKIHSNNLMNSTKIYSNA